MLRLYDSAHPSPASTQEVFETLLDYGCSRGLGNLFWR